MNKEAVDSLSLQKNEIFNIRVRDCLTVPTLPPGRRRGRECLVVQRHRCSLRQLPGL